jgi:hypothetical protein
MYEQETAEVRNRLFLFHFHSENQFEGGYTQNMHTT